MELVTNKAKINIVDYYVDEHNNSITLYSKSSNMKLEFNRIELLDFIEKLNDTLTEVVDIKISDSEKDNLEEIDDLKEKIKEKDRVVDNCITTIGTLQDKVATLQNEIMEYKNQLSDIKDISDQLQTKFIDIGL